MCDRCSASLMSAVWLETGDRWMMIDVFHLYTVWSNKASLCAGGQAADSAHLSHTYPQTSIEQLRPKLTITVTTVNKNIINNQQLMRSISTITMPIICLIIIVSMKQEVKHQHSADWRHFCGLHMFFHGSASRAGRLSPRGSGSSCCAVFLDPLWTRRSLFFVKRAAHFTLLFSGLCCCYGLSWASELNVRWPTVRSARQMNVCNSPFVQ